MLSDPLRVRTRRLTPPQLITIRKTTAERYPPPMFDPAHAVTENVDVHVPAHKDFREKYFQGFKKSDPVAEGSQSG